MYVPPWFAFHRTVHRTVHRAAPALVVALALTLTLAACGGSSSGGGGGGPGGNLPPDPSTLPGASANPRVLAEQVSEAAAASAPVTSLPSAMPEASAVRFLNQATFGSTEAETTAAQQQWRTGWLQAQLELPTGRTHWDRVLADQAALVAADASLDPNNLTRAVWDWSVWEAYLAAPDQLRKRVGYALSQIMVVSMEGLASGGTNSPRLAAGYLDLLESGAFGNFRDLLEAVSLNPAMGYYLSHRGNRKADYPGNDPTKAPTRVPDENYAREVMQLFTIGLYQLNADGTPALANGQPQETYGEDDVRGLARVFTGWDWVARTDPEWPRKPMQHIAARHSPEEKKFLGVTIAAGTDGPTSLRIALDTLFNHPNTAPFIARQLIQRLVTSNPSPAYVGRVAARFADNGSGVRGDMKAVIDAVLRDADAMTPANIARPAAAWGKLREPVLRYTTFARNFGATFSGEIWRVGNLSDPATALGQSPLHSPSVFNFYRPGYVPPNTAIAREQLVAPEFQITTDTSLPGYVNFMQRQLTAPAGGLSLNYDAELALAGDAAALVARLDRRLTNGAMSAATRDEIVAAVTALPSGTAAQNLTRVRTAILMTVACPAYIVQK
jgi:uncharacterized protein (DUF1800 family)